MESKSLLCTTSSASSSFFSSFVSEPTRKAPKKPFLFPQPIRSHRRLNSSPSAAPAAAAAHPSASRKRAENFSERDAFPDSLPLQYKNPHVIYRDVRRLARLGRIKEALEILDYLEHRGIPVNATTFAALLSSCARLRALQSGRQIHVHIRINGLDRNEFLLTKLVEMYATCGSPADAERALAGMETTSVYPWNALLKGNMVAGRRWSTAPVEIFSEMREMGVDSNEYTYACLIKSFAGSPSFSQGMKTHALLIKNGFLSASALLRTCLTDMYFKCRKVRMAQKMFEEIAERDIVSWGAVIAGFTHNGLRREALEHLRLMGSQGITPNSVIVTSILPVVGELLERNLGREIHAFVLRKFRDYHSMVFIQSALIDMYCKCGDMTSGRRVFYGSNERNAVSWTALMSGYASNGRFEQALRSIVWMQLERIKPDVVSIATVLPVCSELKALGQGKEIHAFALKHWFLPNVSISTSLMTMYADCGKLDYSCRVFYAMVKKNVMTWTALVDSYLKNDRHYDALHVFRSMLQANRRPDAVSVTRILKASGEIGALQLGKELHGQVLKMKFESEPVVTAELVRMYGSCKEVEKARKVFDGVRSKGSLTCTAMIEAYGFNSRYREALYLLDWLLLNGFLPNYYTFNAVLSICDRADLHDEALRVFDTMVHNYGMKASEEHYDCLINLLTRAGQIREAQRYSI